MWWYGVANVVANAIISKHAAEAVAVAVRTTYWWCHTDMWGYGLKRVRRCAVSGLYARYAAAPVCCLGIDIASLCVNDA